MELMKNKKGQALAWLVIAIIVAIFLMTLFPPLLTTFKEAAGAVTGKP
ncbi:MAG: hypothetical protein AABX63_05960 [Nanoarchaeota archaeon]